MQCVKGIGNLIKNIWMQRTTQRTMKLLGLSVAGSLKEMLVPDVTLSADKIKLIATAEGQNLLANFLTCNVKTSVQCTFFTLYRPRRRLTLLVEILANKFCPSAVVPALQSIWFYQQFSDITKELNLGLPRTNPHKGQWQDSWGFHDTHVICFASLK